MAKTTYKRPKNRKLASMIALSAVMATTMVVGTMAMTSSSFFRTEHVAVSASDANLTADLYVGTVDTDLAMVSGYTDIADVLDSTALASLSPTYETPALTMTDGSTPIYTDNYSIATGTDGNPLKHRFEDFAPGQVRAISYKLVNTGKVEINLDLSLLAKHIEPNSPITADTWDEQDPLPVFDTAFLLVEHHTTLTDKTASKGGFTKLVDTAKMSTYEGTGAGGDEPVSLTSSADDAAVKTIKVPVGESVELIQLVAFPDGGVPNGTGTAGQPGYIGPNYTDDNIYMNSLFDFTLWFNMSQPAIADSNP